MSTILVIEHTHFYAPKLNNFSSFTKVFWALGGHFKLNSYIWVVHDNIKLHKKVGEIRLYA